MTSSLRRPLIGLSSCIFHADPERPIFKGKSLLYAEESMIHWLMKAGALAFLLPRCIESGPSVGDYIARIDGLLLQGGVDVAPESYGETPLQEEWQGDRVRDLYEIELIQEAVKQGKPILGICRGLQVINTAFGGSLYQDITTQLQGSFEHRNWDIYDSNHHDAIIEPQSAFARLYPNQSKIRINSVHHQGIKTLANDFVAEVYSAHDKIIEAIRHRSHPYLVGVQWHPEFQKPAESDLLDPMPLLEEFITACRSD